MKTISIVSLKEKMAENGGINLLDVREQEERTEFNIGGVFIPLGQIMAMQIDAIEDLKEEEIICYCRSGKRSMQAVMMLETMGFTNVVNLDGGMMEWQSSL
jgi:rhodanese-related sulfurtransferase